MVFTKCWFCKIPGTGGCPWDASKGSTPVPGWSAIPTTLRDLDGLYSIDSYHVVDCPMFVEDPRMDAWSVSQGSGVGLSVLEIYLELGYSDARIAELIGLPVDAVEPVLRQLRRG